MRLFALCVLLSGPLYADAPVSQNTKRLVVHKAERLMTLYDGEKVLKTYQVSLGANPVGNKEKSGDNRTPEGTYTIDRRNAKSAFYRSLHISYPDAADKKRAAAAGVDPGGDIMIHGLKNGLGWIGRLHLKSDWTQGCIAVTNEEIDELWKLVPDGTPIEIAK